MIAAQILPEDALLDECIQAANERGFYLVSDGRRVLVSPVIPAGFRQIKITAKDHAPEVLPCAA